MTRTLTPLQRDARAVVLFFAADLRRAVKAMSRHYPDGRGHCAACSTTGLRWVEFPCVIHILAETAYELMYAIPEPRRALKP